ncbi:hypothetical protein SAMN06265371_106177 [Lutibacter agarilyticus]|uniref:Uncharacterized protein n=1 Tax=Lutibacter agarilyticus TaxID=1109740 RepID=A0A238XP99_9FLAO|nr:hypothetical protein SAMN06265371_106177 [Lutibacter agarilyticus]
MNVNFLIAQKSYDKLNEFEALNGITYKIGDTIKLKKGSIANGEFEYVYFLNKVNHVLHENLSKEYSDKFITIKKIERYNMKLIKGVYFVVSGQGFKNYTLDIQNAILTCEIEDCIE